MALLALHSVPSGDAGGLPPRQRAAAGAIREGPRPVVLLLVDDGPGDAHRTMAALAEPAGRFRVQRVRSLPDALALLATQPFDCVLADLSLPHADDLQILDVLRERYSDTAVLVLSDRDEAQLAVQAIQRGADDYLMKRETSPRQLHQSIAHAVERRASRVAMRRVSARTATVMAALSDGVVAFDADGVVISANPAAERMLGVAAGGLIGLPAPRPPCAFVTRDGRQIPPEDNPVAVAFATGKPAQGVVLGLPGRDGRVCSVEMNTHLLYTADGRVDGVVVSMRDISERLAAEESTRFQAALLATVGQAVIVTDPAGCVMFWNAAAERLYGWTSAEAVGRPVVEMLVSQQSLAQGEQIIAALAAGHGWTGDFRVQRRDGTEFPALVSDAPVFDDRHRLVAIIGVSTDISERKAAEETARALAVIVESSADGIFTATPDGTIRTWNRGAEELFGYRASEVIGQHLSLLLPAGADSEVDSVTSAVAAGNTVRNLGTVRRHRDGRSVDVALTASPIFGADGVMVAASVIARDISERCRLERELAQQATHDPLTGLPNRRLLDDRLTQALIVSARESVPVAVLLLDLDQFKTINDATGHQFGDRLLKQVAERLRAWTRPTDTVARFSGDEFAIVCQGTGRAEAKRIAVRLGKALSSPFEIDGQRRYISASIGIAVTPPLKADASMLLRAADAAMYDAKARGRAQWRMFDEDMAAQSIERLELTTDLREALARDELEVRYQPVVDLGTGDLVGLEALTRWHHPIRGWVPPSQFVPLAEQTGLSSALDRWVLARACRDAAKLRLCGALPLSARMAVNISAPSLSDPGLVQRVRDSASAAQLPLDALELEVTETSLLADAESARLALAALSELGVGIALDDFGTGYSSLTHLRQFPVTTIKIDLGFVQHVADEPDDLAIVTSVVDLARSLGLRTVAEGIETPAQLSLLHRLGCAAGQGYLWSPALARDELVTLLRSQPGGFVAATSCAAPGQIATEDLSQPSSA